MGQLSDLITPLDQMTDKELEQRLFDIRHRREVSKPAAEKHKKKAITKVKKKEMTAAEKLLATLTPEQLEILFKEFTS